MRLHQMMHANRLEHKFVINHIRWTTSPHPCESKSQTMFAVYGFLGSVTQRNYFFFFARLNVAHEFRGFRQRDDQVRFTSDKSENTCGPVLG